MSAWAGYDAWLERPYQEAAERAELWERAEEEADRRGDGSTADDIVAEWEADAEDAAVERAIEAAEARAEDRAESYLRANDLW